MIKQFLKVFIVSILLIVSILSVTALGYIFLIDRDMVIGKDYFVDEKEEDLAFYQSTTFDYGTSLGRAASNYKRFNILIVGLENYRTDAIILLSYDIDNKEADIISIPKDTYFPRSSDDSPELKKINAIYAEEGIGGLTLRIEKMLGIPLEKYIIIDYEGLIACVDLLGGVEVNIPFHMEYADPYDNPPLYIDIPEGIQLLDGVQSLKFLRYREGYAGKDLERIEAQGQFIKAAVKKALNFQLPELIREAYSYIETNIKIVDLIDLSGDLVGFSAEDINMYTLPGMEAPLEGLTFYIPNDEEIMKLFYSLYGLI